jgi:hypothetical protein
MKVCVDWAEESYQECAEWQDQGYNSCDQWDANCCDWWPCSWACKIITWVCIAWVWVSNVVCVLWTTITTLVCIAWEIVVTVLAAVGIIIELILSIPIIGRLLDEILNIVTAIIWRVVSIPDSILTVIGITPLKKIRLCIIILRDEDGVPTATEAGLQPAISAAQDIFRDQANVEVIVDQIVTVDSPAPTFALDVNCNLGAWGEDLWLTGSYFDAITAVVCPRGAIGRITGFTNQIVVFCVRQIPGSTAGCALGPATDYLTIEGSLPVCLAHEMAHKTGLWHCCTGVNLANGTCGGTQMEWWQRVIVRNSEFVTYL